MMIRLFAAMGLALALSQAVWAQDDAQARLEAARETMVLSGAEAGAVQMMDMMMPSMRPALRQQYPNASSEQLDQAMTLISETMAATGPEIVEVSAQAYANRFTLAELEEINAFYRSETGVKMVRLLPALMQEGAIEGQQIAMLAMGSIQPQIQAIMTE